MIWVWLACAEPEAQRVAAAMRLASTDPAAALAPCSALADPADRGQCVTVAAAHTHDPGTCDTLAAGFWQDECRFVVAEGVLALGDAARARTLCADAGTLAEDCARHVWKRAQAEGTGASLPVPAHQDPLRERLRGLQPMSTSACDGDAACETLAVEILLRRWDRDASDPALLDALCAGDVSRLPPRLRWDPSSPALVTALAARRRSACLDR